MDVISVAMLNEIPSAKSAYGMVVRNDARKGLDVVVAIFVQLCK